MNSTLFDKVKKDKNELDDEYYGYGTLMTNFNNFRTNLRQDELKNNLNLIPTNESKMFYENQGVKQVFKPLTNDGIYRHIIAYYPFQRLYMDTMYLRLNNSTLAFINIIDLFSKYAFSKMFIIGAKAQAVKSISSVQTFTAFLEEITKYGYTKKDLGEVILDAGSEFLGDFIVFLNTEEILNTYANPGDKKKMSPIERFNKTLRLYIEKYRVIYGKIDNNVLQKIMTSYNNVSHANLTYTPIQILENKKDQLIIEQHFLDLGQENHLNSLKIGQEVRILLNQTPFQKIKPVWSNEVYKIIKVINGSNYQLENMNGYFHLDELQPINTDYLLNQKKVNLFKDEEPNEVFIPPLPKPNVEEVEVRRGERIRKARVILDL